MRQSTMEGFTAIGSKRKHDDAIPSSTTSEKKVRIDPVTYKEVSRTPGDKLYDIIADAPFGQSQEVPFSFLVSGLQEIEKCKGENSKEAMKEIISNMLRSICLLNYSLLSDAFYFFICKLDSDYKCVNIGMGDSSIIKSVSKACGRDEKHIKESLNECGDLGTVVSESKSNISTISSFFVKKEKKILSLKEVMFTLRKIANLHGQSSNTEKGNLLIKLLLDADKNDAKYIVRFIQGNLKTGAAEKTYLSGLARAIILTPPNVSPAIKNTRDKLSLSEVDKRIEAAEKHINRAICEYPDYDGLFEALFITQGKTYLLKDHCYIRPGIPVKPMLAKPTKGIPIVLHRFENQKFTCKYKYDGFRTSPLLKRRACKDIFMKLGRHT
jgi:DNA ligase 1